MRGDVSRGQQQLPSFIERALPVPSVLIVLARGSHTTSPWCARFASAGRSFDLGTMAHDVPHLALAIGVRMCRLPVASARRCSASFGTVYSALCLQSAALEQVQFLGVVLGRAVSGGAFVCARPYG
jgi:hypothetical protein